MSVTLKKIAAVIMLMIVTFAVVYTGVYSLLFYAVGLNGAESGRAATACYLLSFFVILYVGFFRSRASVSVTSTDD